MRDWMGRDIHYLRISLTERCNLKCIYCREETAFCKAKEELTLDDLTELMQAFTVLGIRRVRLTGGEPLIRKDLEQIVHMISSFPQIHDLSMTTNAQGLANRVARLHQLGLKRINISLDSLDPERYRSMTRGGDFNQVMCGIDAALAEGMPVKINAVLVRGENEEEADDFIQLAREYPVDVRFIELMPFSALGTQDKQRVLNSEILARHPELCAVPPRDPSQPSEDYQAEGFAGRVGFISPISHKFCSHCSRVRLTSEGKLRMCLGNDRETDLRPWLHAGTEQLTQVLRDAIYHKPEAHAFESNICAQRAMNQIGG
ncbi:MAG: GTP 3',8-cyclase MoaA [Eubacteriales bacterium]|nr:GTP 3',8-cyclase MoaA [Eubacteriales bacterium]